MLQNYFTIAGRHLLKSKLMSGISALGLAVGMAAAFLILQYISFEMGYDRFHANRESIFRVVYDKYENGNPKENSATTFYGVGPWMKAQFPEVEHVTHIYRWPANAGVMLFVNNQVYNERSYLFAEPDFFKVFPSLLLRGNPSTCLSNPNTIVLSQKMAEKMFGSQDPMGKEVVSFQDGKQVLTVTGIMETPANSHFDVDVLLPYDRQSLMADSPDWKYANNWTYFTVRDGTTIKDLEVRLNEALQKEQKDNEACKGVYMTLQSIQDIHLGSHRNDELKTNGNASFLYVLGISAIVILLMAWFNYVNLETSRFLKRVREVGVRRVIGSTRREIILQFLVQYVCLISLAAVGAIVIVVLVLPYYQMITNVPVAFVGTVPVLWTISLVIFLLGMLAAGIYPAFYVSGFDPVQSLKGKIQHMRTGVVRNALLVFQFCSSVALLGLLMVISGQLDFMRLADKSMNLDQVLIVYNPTAYANAIDSLRKERNQTFRNELLKSSGITDLTTSSAIPGEPVGFTYEEEIKRNLADPIRKLPYKVVFVDYSFIPVFGLELLAGRNYDEANGEDNSGKSLILTERAIHELGFSSPAEAAGQKIYFRVTVDWQQYTIIGVVKDYYHESVKVQQYPTILFLHRNIGQMVYYSMVLHKQAEVNKAIQHAESAWKATWPERSFSYFFADSYYDQQFKSEVSFGNIFRVFAIVAVFIACLGVLGMTLFENNARLKEVSIRKVLGATVFSLVGLLTRENFRLLAISLLVSAPVIYFLSSQWLASYPVRIALSWTFVAIPFTLLAVLVGLVAGFQTISAASTNPVDHLKDD